MVASMNDNRRDVDPYAVVKRINQATSEHDIDALVGCFTRDYESVWPVHPARTFVGTEQVRRNWGQIFSSVPDVRTHVTDSVVSGESVWTEWEFAGHRLDGQSFLMRGVVILRVQNDRATHARFYLEPVEADAEHVDAAVRRLVGAPVDHAGTAAQ
jgi:ketosteroid isomerase-like protein